MSVPPERATATSAGDRGSRRLVLVLIPLLALVLLGPHQPVRWGPMGWLDARTAAAAATVARLAGLEVAATRYGITHPGGFACEIYYRCTGLLPALFLVGAILAAPVPFRRRWRGALLGVGFVLALNLLRLVLLIAVGIHFPTAFGTAHSLVGEALVVVAVVAFWAAWIGRTRALTVPA